VLYIAPKPWSCQEQTNLSWSFLYSRAIATLCLIRELTGNVINENKDWQRHISPAGQLIPRKERIILF
jgi:hypothetical protein